MMIGIDYYVKTVCILLAENIPSMDGTITVFLEP
jgi:hypothetical protein